MSKRSTTGIPKPGQPKAETEAPRNRLQPKLLREYRSRHERETEIQRLVVLGTAIAIGAALLILIFAIASDTLIVPNQAVASINGQNISVAQFRTRAKIERALLIQQLNNAIALYQSFGATSDQISQAITSQQPYSTWYGQLQVADQLGNSVLNTMVEDELVRQKAAELGITVSDADIDAQINKLFGYDPATAGLEPTATPSPTSSPTPLVSPTPSLVPTASPTPLPTSADVPTGTPTLTPFPTATASPTPNATERADNATTLRNDFFSSVRGSTGVSDADIREYFRMQALREKVRDAVITDVGDTSTYVNARHILVATEAEAQTALVALEDGELFSTLAQNLSTDQSSSNGGELGWTAASGFVTEFADAVKTAEIGALVGPVQSQFGFHIIQVRAREERPLTDNDRTTVLNTEFDQYLKDLRAADTSNVHLFDAWTDNVPTEPIFAPVL
ncbi:MAG: peptidylprolyl isomerase [Chloroflexota bacterium]